MVHLPAARLVAGFTGRLAMPFDAPFVLGPFTIDTAGRLRPTEPGRLPGFALCWRGCAVRVELHPAEADAAVMSLQATAGRVPSTAAAGSFGRAAVFAALAELPGLLPDGWRLRLRPDHRLELAAEAGLALPATVSELLSAVTLFLLAAAPYLDLLGDAGVEAAGVETGGREAGGSVNT
jgi:hypothetical protein